MARREEIRTNLTIFEYDKFVDKVDLGKGEFGEVYGAKHPMFPKVAIKILSRNFHARAEDRESLKNEASRLLSIVSEHVLRLLGVVMEPQHLCLVFEYAEYGSLDKALQRCQMGWPLKIRMAYQIALGMMFLHHRNILHLRLKCANVLVDGNMCAKISDVLMSGVTSMGMWTRFAYTYSQSRARSITNTPSSANIAYLPPELIRDVNCPPGKPNDVYAYGIILWQILSNEYPYNNEPDNLICEAVLKEGRPSLMKIPPDRPEILYTTMVQCWRQIKENRPTFEQIQKELEHSYEENVDNAKNSALECQRVLNEFNLKHGYYITAPESDVALRRNVQHPAGTTAPQSVMVPPGNVQHSADADSIATGILVDEAVIPKKVGQGIGNVDASTHEKVFFSEQGGGLKNEAKPIPPEELLPRAEVPERIQVDIEVQQNQMPAEGSPKLASTENMYTVATELGRNWRRFGLYLGFTDGELDNIEANYHANGYPEIPYQMLRQWREREGGNLTLGYLVSKLKANRFEFIVLKLNP